MTALKTNRQGRMCGRLVLMLALILPATPLIAGPPEFAPGAARANPVAFPEVSLPQRANREEAISRLGDKLPAVAAYYGSTPAEFMRLLREDDSAWIDVKGRLLYIEQSQPAGEDGATDPLQTASYPLSETFNLSSRPGSKRTIYMDFDGHQTTGTAWNNSSGVATINSPPYTRDGDPSFSTSELQNIQGMWRQAAEDFAPFDVNVTTKYPGEAALTRAGSDDDVYGMRVLITQDNFDNCGCGGFAYLTSFNDTNDYYKPAFVFNGSMVGAGEAISHEIGHTLSLHHDGLSGGATYYSGHGSGDTGWAPIMGSGYNRPLVQWSKGEYSGANETEDDLVRMPSYGALLLPDDHANVDSAASPLDLDYTEGNRAFMIGTGMIRRRDDIDVFSFITGAGLVSVTVNPAPGSPNLDVKADLYNSSGALLASVNPLGSLSATVNAALDAGEYFLRVDGVGKDPVSGHEGYSDYASLGRYSIVANIADPGGLSPPQAVATAPDYSPAIAPLFIGFNGSGSSDSDGNIVAWSWNFGDGASDSGVSASHTYDAPGTYTVTLTVTDNDTLTNSDSLTVTVNNQLPVAVASAGDTSGTAPVTVNFSSIGSYDPDVSGSISSYAWSFGDGGSSAAANPSHTYNAAGSFNALLTVTDNLGATGSSVPVVVNIDPPLWVDQFASGQVPGAGTVTGSYLDTHDQDIVMQSIRERESGGRKSNRHSYLQHDWTFNVQPGDGVTLSLTGRRSSSSDGDQMLFTYSVNGGSYQALPISLGTSTSSFPDIFLAGAAVGGEVRVRVKDSDQTSGNRSLDTVWVDQIRIRTDNQGGDIPLPDAAIGLGASAVSSSQIALTWTDNASNETGYRVERSPDGSSWGTVDTVGANQQGYSDTGLNGSTQYFYRVFAYNSGGDAASPSNTGSATTQSAPAINLASASGYKVKGRQWVSLSWSPAGMDVYRDNSKVATVGGTTHEDNIGRKGGGSYTYKVCVIGVPTECSNERTVAF